MKRQPGGSDGLDRRVLGIPDPAADRGGHTVLGLLGGAAADRLGGYRRPSAICSGVTSSASRVAAAANIESVTLVALVASAPRPTPGKM